MNYKLILTVENGKQIYDCFLAEEKNHKRSSYTIELIDNNLIFKVQAQDATALRATTDNIIKLLTVYEKVKKNE